MKKNKLFKGLKKKKHPPKSERYCLCCEDMTEFKYNNMVGHSECKECGGRSSKRFDPNEKKV